MSFGGTHLVTMTLLLAVGAGYDVLQRRIPNVVTVAAFVVGALAQALTAGLSGLGSGLAAALGVGVLLAPLWTLRMLGGGDLKLAVAAAVWVGLARTPRFLLASAVMGGALALITYARAGSETRMAIRANVYRLHVPSWPRAAESHGRYRTVPYGVAFAVGALFAVCTS
jgi:prepilin peptidase CpaA